MGETSQDNGRGRRYNRRGRQDDGWDEAGWGQGGHRQLAYSSSPLSLFSNEIFGPTVKSPNGKLVKIRKNHCFLTAISTSYLELFACENPRCQHFLRAQVVIVRLILVHGTIVDSKGGQDGLSTLGGGVELAA
ncbi:hypothetical protein DFH08DRAFT_821044 [Mycena albidolilacea]|uniref:Uncharacterized protein n=1 Tax=Mycena albidolilacea TaxID=1033008 RepID=A0AAD6ZAP3_9AGAR|nr:hypothetical protein DFH08DRAFT_821044 [Mycena albidolilacea]